MFHKCEKGNAKGTLVGWLCLNVLARTSEENEVLVNQMGMRKGRVVCHLKYSLSASSKQKSCSVALKAEKQPQLWAITFLPPLYWHLRNACTTFLCVLNVLYWFAKRTICQEDETVFSSLFHNLLTYTKC